MPAALAQHPIPASDAALRDADLAALVQAGRLNGAFEGIMARYESKVFHLCMALLRDTHAAEDIAQESFLRIWRALPGYRSETASLSTWIYAITRNRCLTELARRPHCAPACEDIDMTDQDHTAAPSPVDTRALAVRHRSMQTMVVHDRLPRSVPVGRVAQSGGR